ncbi:sensor histidine kinase, partial [Bacillus vallismortis]|nr:sensor histidine kinase [Bacillus vallismortis]
ILVVKNIQLRLKVIDNVKGFTLDQVKASSFGLNSMIERASEIGGVAEVFSVEGKFSQIYVKVPFFPEVKGVNDRVSSII